ncbi:aminodeoxychorismate synthase component I [Antrihabitans cavernicola]|uniref:aminodeoxychorismate synthase n=1 Tax=Antrihabitans cavernicola TaxID=2495913 RepID=A0A5A7SBT8_9NOCA|nr:aminodeoxychorismate synthase component I [Spelaeibacter cavernicola]KAA0023024.1 aminodeoxychorismate synthase component I [Spelaeibacter cavernicola]
MRTLLIDNYDSFTYNLFQLISVVNGVEPTVVHNDAPFDDLHLDDFDNVVISPGPGHPSRSRDFGVSAAVLHEAQIPVLGVCLGHQGIVVSEGGTVSAAPTPRHGFVDRIRHADSALFNRIPQDFNAVRYHSLAADQPLPDVLEATAWSQDGVIMALRHRSRPQWGVQFHPESIASEFGEQLFRNFAALTPTDRAAPTAKVVSQGAPPKSAYRLDVEVLDRAVDAEGAFSVLYADSAHALWLDSEYVEPGLDRFSFLGDASGPLSEVVRYRIEDRGVDVERASGKRIRLPGTIFDYLSEQLRVRAMPTTPLPFDFACGYAGYFGYELKSDVGSPNRHRSRNPDATWIFLDRLVVVDHTDGKTYLLALDDGTHAGAVESRRWIAETSARLTTVPDWTNPAPLTRTVDHAEVERLLVRGRSQYLADIAVCQERLRAGESYEICLTDNATVPVAGAALDFYRVLRRCNPAPYAAFLHLDDISVACSSPERFLKIDRKRVVETKPIKGTARRGTTPAEDAKLVAELASSTKTRAENLMIVDLLRNDLGRVCEIGSVHVPTLMATETYATVHQLVSTIRGTLRPEFDVIDCVRACFPGGSMTGAPKLRTMEITDELESEARGIYSGTIGFLGLNGTADLNIVIRTAVATGGVWQVGAGGAIVLDSDAGDEFHEMVLKAAATLRAAGTSD